MTKEINSAQKMQLIGLLALARNHNEHLANIEVAARDLLGVTRSDEIDANGIGDPQHIGDAVYSGYSADYLLEHLGISVKPMKKASARKGKG